MKYNRDTTKILRGTFILTHPIHLLQISADEKLELYLLRKKYVQRSQNDTEIGINLPKKMSK